MDILSIDWDYFFPDVAEFDWGMGEGFNAFGDILWHIRYWNRGILSGNIAHESVVPDKNLIKWFWPRVLKNTTDPLIIITESHSDISEFISLSHSEAIIWNFDQHHDSGYRRNFQNEILDCGNWALKNWSQIKQYNLIYPSWRQENDEAPPKFDPDNIYFSIPESFPDFKFIFVCRSSPWTPSWADNDWINFISLLSDIFPKQYQNGIKLEYVLKPRPFDVNITKQFNILNKFK